MSCNGDCGNCSGIEQYQFGDELKCLSQEKTFTPTRRLPTSAIVNVTDECNNACPYCFVNFRRNYMNYDTAKQTALFLLENVKKNGEEGQPTFCFFGGEPLIQFDAIIKPLITEFGSRLKWSITTNGTLLTEEIIDFFVENNVSVLLSWDGVKEVHDKQRPLKNGKSGYDEIMKNIHYLMLKLPDTCCRATITKLNAKHIMEDILLFERIGATNCAFAVNEEETWDDEIFDAVKDEFTKVCLYIYKKLIKMEKVIRVNPITEIYSQLESARFNPTFFNGWNRCGMGTTSIGVSCDGTLHPCQEENSSDNYVIGDVNTGIDFNKRDAYINEYFNNMKNLTCSGMCSSALRYVCFNGQCPNKVMHNRGKISDTRCAYMRAIFYSVARIHKLCRASVFPNIRDYFGEEN